MGGREALPFFTSFILASILAVVMSPVTEWIIGRLSSASAGHLSHHFCDRAW
jgi:predicted PurR-regulated permease PerM